MTREERMEYVRQAILHDVWAGENSTVEDVTVNRIVDKWEADLAEAVDEVRYAANYIEGLDR